MAHEICKNHYDDWGKTVHCEFHNVFNGALGRTVGENLQRVLGIEHFKASEMAKLAPNSYKFTCTRKEANLIRDELIKATTESYANVWFSMQDDPFHYLHNRHSMLAEDRPDVRDYSVSCYFGAMYSCNQFMIHSEQHPSIMNLRLMKWRDEPESIRIMSADRATQIFIPIKWLHKPLLVNLHERPCVVLMLKHSVKMKKEVQTNGKLMYHRECWRNDSSFIKTLSKSSDILLSFTDIQHTFAFVKELTRETDEYYGKFNIYFVTLKREVGEELRHSLRFPPAAPFKHHYALDMLMSMGYLFQDKYTGKLRDEFLAFDKEHFNDLCYFLKEKLESDHCYHVRRVFDDFAAHMRAKQNEGKESEAGILYCVGCVSITPLRILYQRMQPTIGNRALRLTQLGGEERFLLVHIREENNQKLKDFDRTITKRLKQQMFGGIEIVGKVYQLFGTSTSQLKEASFWFLAVENEFPIERAWECLGDFSGVKNIAKYIARIGLYFSTSRETRISFSFKPLEQFSKDQPYSVTLMPDVKTPDDKYCFTDGIGTMSLGVAALIALRLNIPLTCREDIPSAYQVRIAGCKGMLAIEPGSKLSQYYIKVRESMRKFHSKDWQLEICEYSKPLELKLNNQIIMLLSDLGNRHAVFESYQNAALSTLPRISEQEQRRKLRYLSAKDDLLRNKIPLPLNEARNMFGVVDETNTLDYGQVFVQYKDMDASDDRSYIVLTGEVLVTKNPCLHPGDFRKFTAVNVPQLRECIRDCIVFPQRGPRPHPNEISGSDLDGDQYWVYWGKSLKIARMDTPLSYDAAVEKQESSISREMVVDHIIESFGAASQGIICDVHLAIADAHDRHTRSDECKYLAELFARAVDAPKSGEIIDLNRVYELRARHCRAFPQFMKKYDQPVRESDTILNRLFLHAKRHFHTQRSSISSSAASINDPPPRARRTRAAEPTEELKKWLASRASSISVDEQSAPKDKPVKTTKPKASPKEPPQALADKRCDSSTSLASNLSIDTPDTPPAKPAKRAPAKASRPPAAAESSSASASDETKKASERTESVTLINSASASVTSKPSASASLPSDNPLVQRILFDGMTMKTNQIRWTEAPNNAFSVDLEKSPSAGGNWVDKLVPDLLKFGKEMPRTGDAQLTMVIAWGQLFLRLSPAAGGTKPKNIKELDELMSLPNGVEYLFEGDKFGEISQTQVMSGKLETEYVLVCRSRELSTEETVLIFNEKKRLEKVSLSSTRWICAVRHAQGVRDSLVTIRQTKQEINRKDETFSAHLQSIFRAADKTDLLSGTSPRLTIDRELLKPTVQIVSLKRMVRYEFNRAELTRLGPGHFETLNDLQFAFYEAIDISTEKVDGKVQTRDTLELHVTRVQFAKKHEEDLKQLVKRAGQFFE